MPDLEDIPVSELFVEIDFAELQAAKLRLGKLLPDVKSSHRCEAFARGLGYRAYASLLAAVRSQPIAAHADGAAFAGYLLEHGFGAGAATLYRVLARLAIARVLVSTPCLSHWGIGAGAPQLKADRTWETASEKHERFQEERRTLAQAEDEFLLSLSFLSRIEPTATIRPGAGSYRLKHLAESSTCEYPGGATFGPRYVANGSMIAAAIHLGFRYRAAFDHLGYEVPNVEFNMSKSMIDDLDCRLRPGGGLAADRRHKLQRRQGRSHLQNWQLALGALA